MKVFAERRPCLCARGFTLAESLIAIAIVSFTLLTIIGLMPPGLDHLKKSDERAAVSRIVASIVAEHETLNWQDVLTLEGQQQGPFFYDFQGLPVSAGSNEVSFAARAQIGTETKPLPGTNNSPFLRRLTVQVSARGRTANPFSGDPGVGYTSISTLLVRSDAEQGKLSETEEEKSP